MGGSVRKQTISKIAELKQEVDQNWADDRYKEYLCSEMTDLIVGTWHCMAKYEEFEEGRCVEMQIITGRSILDNIRKLKRLQGRVIALRKGIKDSISKEMIQAAQDYPFEELHEFKRNFALCPFHEDKTPSMSLKNNRAKCWSCNKSWDTIQFVMDKDGMTFKEAVLRLQ
jgi:hypothetical protein